MQEKIKLGLASHHTTALKDSGFFCLRRASQADLVDVLDALGCPIHVEEVRDTPRATSLVRSRAAIPWHTDHHRAEWIVWFCLSSAEQGGDTIIADGHAALNLLEPQQVSALRRVTLFEHSIFRGDEPRHSMLVNGPDGRIRLYYSLWLADDAMSGAEREAFEAFGEALGRVDHRHLMLKPGDILAIDNTRMVHARTEIGGEGVRHLRRYWLTAR